MSDILFNWKVRCEEISANTLRSSNWPHHCEIAKVEYSSRSDDLQVHFTEDMDIVALVTQTVQPLETVNNVDQPKTINMSSQNMFQLLLLKL